MLADLFHQGDGKGAGGDDIGDAGPVDQPGHPAPQHRRLGRTALEAPQQRKRQPDEVLAGAGPVEHGAEQYKKENHGGRHIQRNAVNAGTHGHLTDEPVQGNPFKLNDLRHIGTQEGIENEKGGNDRKGRTDDASGGFQQQNDQDEADGDITKDRCAVAQRQPVVIDNNV